METTESRSRIGNITAAVLLLLVGVTTLVQTVGLDGNGDASDPGSGGYPMLIATVLIALSVLLTLQRGGGEALPSRFDGLRVIGAVALLLIYVSVMDSLGYVISTVLFLALALLLMGIRTIPLLVVVPVGFSTVLFLMFYNVFGVSLPRGFLERLIS